MAVVVAATATKVVSRPSWIVEVDDDDDKDSDTAWTRSARRSWTRVGPPGTREEKNRELQLHPAVTAAAGKKRKRMGN